jgi:uncharacterized membrane protein HdeD (DUF308 family)
MKIENGQADDMSLRWTMRIIGLVLAVCAIVFLQQDIFTSQVSTWFFGLCAGLGVITLISSWLPGPEKVQLQENPVAQPMPQRRPNL